MPPSLSPRRLMEVCREIDETIHRLAAAQASGLITQEDFVSALLRWEMEKAGPNGLVFTASHTFDDWTVVSLRSPGRSKPYVAFEFLPSTGEFRPVGTPCRNREQKRAA